MFYKKRRRSMAMNPFVKNVKVVELDGWGQYRVDELIRPATLQELFGSYGVPIEDLCFPREEFDRFIELHAGKLNPHGFGNFFLVERVGGLSVIQVCLCKGCCEAYEEDLFSSGRVWRPEFGHRVVVPKIN